MANRVRFKPKPRLFDLMVAYANVLNRCAEAEAKSRYDCPPLPLGEANARG